jgi:hypothetical protein
MIDAIRIISTAVIVPIVFYVAFVAFNNHFIYYRSWKFHNGKFQETKQEISDRKHGSERILQASSQSFAKPCAI